MTLRRALVFSPLLFAFAAATPACGARSFLTEDTPPEASGTGGVGGAGGAGTTTSTTSSTTTSSSATSSTTTSSSTTASSSSTSASSSSSSSSSGTGGTGGGTTHPVISESPNQFLQAETSVVAAPNGIVSVAWIDVNFQGRSTIGYAFSTDDGQTFAAPQQIQSPGNRVASDPVLAVDAAGNVYVTWVAFQVNMGGNVSSMRMYVAIAPAGSTTFGAPIQISAPMDNGAQYDKPWITVTNTGALVVTYERNTQNNDLSLIAARSTDGGMTWQRNTIAHDATGNVFRNLAFPCAPQNGSHLWVTYIAFDAMGASVRLARSDDGGVTWLPEVTVSQPNESVAFDDPSCAADGDQVWVTYGLSDDPIDMMAETMQKLGSVRLAYSNDAGKSIASYAEAADLPAAKFFMHPQIVREDDGALDLVYYTGSADQDQAGTYRRARAPLPMGFSPSEVVESPIVFLQARSDPRWLGDYTGVYWRGGQLYTSYVVNETGTSHVAFAKYPAP